MKTTTKLFLIVVTIQFVVNMMMYVSMHQVGGSYHHRDQVLESYSFDPHYLSGGLPNAMVPQVRDEMTGCILPNWVNGGPDTMAFEINKGSRGLTDKANGKDHGYHTMYYPYMASMVRKRYCAGVIEASNGVQPQEMKPIKILEIGLGCAPGGGMIRKTPGGSPLAWRYLFGSERVMELHVLEYDEDCAKEWDAEHPNVATVHTGDASSPQDLAHVVEEAGPFDVIIDDGSHINWHQIFTLEYLISSVNPGGFYVVEDIHSSCLSWEANIGTQERGVPTGGTKDCMTTDEGGPTIFAKLVEWQKGLILKREPFPGVSRIDFHKEAVVLEKS
ncbi:Hard-surface induced protein [Fragilaria crotonensis]|nr:Hard-surface induced protein [Fragilaria crotonensis]